MIVVAVVPWPRQTKEKAYEGARHRNRGRRQPVEMKERRPEDSGVARSGACIGTL